MSPVGLFSGRPLPKRGQTCYMPAPPQSLNGSIVIMIMSVCCMFMCVVIPFILDAILDVRLVDAPAGVTQDFSTFLLRCLPEFFSREGFDRLFPSSTVKSNFVYLRTNRSPLVEK